MAGKDLNDTELRRACQDAAFEVLETMFFEVPIGQTSDALPPTPGSLLATTRFEGSRQGSLSLGMSHECCGRLAAGFLGLEEDQVGDAERASMLVELANMLCGATFSRLEPAGRLRIAQPAIVDATQAECGPWLAIVLDSGTLHVAVKCGAPA